MTKTRSQLSDAKIKAPTAANAPAEKDVASVLGAAQGPWNAIIAVLTARYGEIKVEWKATKGDFGWACLLKHKKRTLLYLIPERKKVLVAIVLGERAVALAMASGLPQDIKKLISEARKYVEGRGIRFHVRSHSEVAIATELVKIKTTPK